MALGEELPRAVSTVSLDEIVQALKARAGYDVLYPEGRRRERIEFVARLTGPLPDAYDIFGAGVYLETVRTLKEEAKRAVALAGKVDGDVEPIPFDWTNVDRHDLLRSLEDITVSLGRGKGRAEGVEIAKTVPNLPQDGRWSWRSWRRR